ncbi:MAG: hypothetical protein JOY94_10170 [Methylobacteriaceae bacterium]|nr:hypothetical protein [Methylobacteriaceae bacterium]
MSFAPQLLLVCSVAAVGILHTIVPDHWLPIALIARQRGWSPAETAHAALQAGAGHVLSTLAIAVVVWLAGVAAAAALGRLIDTAVNIALIAFGGWVIIAALVEMRHAARDRASAPRVAEAGLSATQTDSPPSGRTALLLIVGSSPMVEGIPAFFAAGKYGLGVIGVMAVVFAVSTMATYVVLCVYSTMSLQRVRLGPIERYGEVLSGALIALIGLAFLIWPIL